MAYVISLIVTCISTAVDIENLLPEEHNSEDNDKLVDGLAQDILGHGGGDEGRGATVRFSKHIQGVP